MDSQLAAGTNAKLAQEGKQINEDVTAALAQESAQATAAGSTDTTTESPLTNNVELSSSVRMQPIVGPIQTPSLANIGQGIETGLQQGSLPGGSEQWTTFFDPTAGAQVAQNRTTGDDLVWDSTNEEWNPAPQIPEIVVSATREPSAAQYAADQRELANQSNELAGEIFGSFGPYALLKGIYNSGVGVVGDLGYLGVRALGGSTQTADTVSAFIDRAQVSSGALEQAIAQSASPYLRSGYQGLASVVGNEKADDLSHVLGLGLNALGVAPVVEPLSAAGSSLREGVSQLGDIFPSGSAGNFGTGGAPLTGHLGQLNLDAFLPGEEAAPSATNIEALDVPNTPSGLLNGNGEVLANSEETGVPLQIRAQPSFVLGASDGGPGTWVISPKYPTDPTDAAFQQAATGAPAGVEYAVPTTSMPSGIKYFDGYDPQTGFLVDAKNYVNWPKENLGFSMDAVTTDLIQSDQIAGEVGTQAEIRVASPAKANLLQNIVNEQGLANTIIRTWGK